MERESLSIRRAPEILSYRSAPSSCIASCLLLPEAGERDVSETPTEPPQREDPRFYHALGLCYHPPGYSRTKEFGLYGIRPEPLADAEVSAFPYPPMYLWRTDAFEAAEKNVLAHLFDFSRVGVARVAHFLSPPILTAFVNFERKMGGGYASLKSTFLVYERWEIFRAGASSAPWAALDSDT